MPLHPLDATYIKYTKCEKYIVKAEKHCIFLINVATNKQILFAGNEFIQGYENGPMLDSLFYNITDLFFNNDETILYIVDCLNNCIRCANIKTGKVSTFAGVGSTQPMKNVKFDHPVQKEMAYFDKPQGAIFSPNYKFMYICDSGHDCIRKINMDTGIVTLFAGCGMAGLVNGSCKDSKFNKPRRIIFSPDSKFIYVLEVNNSCIRKINIELKTVDIFAGGGNLNTLERRGKSYTTRKKSLFYYPKDFILSPDCQMLLLCDVFNDYICTMSLCANNTNVSEFRHVRYLVNILFVKNGDMLIRSNPDMCQYVKHPNLNGMNFIYKFINLQMSKYHNYIKF
jgi:6-phosphogluconolactonase (cycloisomerase 2 family)